MTTIENDLQNHCFAFTKILNTAPQSVITCSDNNGNSRLILGSVFKVDNKEYQNNVSDVVLVPFLLTLNSLY